MEKRISTYALTVFILALFVLAVLSLPRSVRAETFTEDLDVGSQGPEVRFLAELLSTLPETSRAYPNTDSDINDIFGPQDQAAVTLFQYAYMGMRDTTLLGRVEASTRAALNAVISEETPTGCNGESQLTLDSYRSSHTTGDYNALQATLAERMEEMKMFCAVNPEKAREMFQTRTFLKGVPKALRPLVEEASVHLTGTIINTIEEQPVAPFATERRTYLLGKKGVKHRLPRDFQMTTGTRVSLRGTRMGGDFFPGSGVKDVRIVGNAAKGLVTIPAAQENLAVVLLEFPDLPHVETPQAVATAMSAINTFYSNASYGQTHVTVQMTPGWHMATKKWGGNSTGLSCDFFGVINEAIAAAGNEIDWSKVTVLIPVLAQNTKNVLCNRDQYGAGGGILSRVSLNTPAGARMIGTAIVNDGIVTFGDKPHTQIHEFTHTFGIYHTGIVSCRDGVLSANVTTCNISNSPTDLMGVGTSSPNGWGIGDLNAQMKNELGWHTGSYPVVNVTTPGTYQLSVAERTSPGTKALRLERNSSETLWLEYRQPEGNDVPIGGAAPAQKGLFVHARLPSLDALYYPEVYLVPPQPTLSASTGQTWYDSVSQWALTPTADNGSTMTVNIEKFPPLRISTHKKTVKVGQSFTLSVTGGRDPLHWINTSGGPVVYSTQRSVTLSYGTAGTYSVSVILDGTSIHEDCTIVVQNTPVINSLTIDGKEVSAPDLVFLPHVHQAQNVIQWSTTYATRCIFPPYFTGTPEYPYLPPSGSLSLTLTGNLVNSIEGLSQYFQCDAGTASSKTPKVPLLIAISDDDYESEITTAAGDHATCLGIKAPAQVNQGEAFTAEVTMQNTGNVTWITNETPHRLRPHEGGRWDASTGNSGLFFPHTSRWTVTEVPLPKSPVYPGEIVTFRINAVANVEPSSQNPAPPPAFPTTLPGPWKEYSFYWKMSEDGANTGATSTPHNVNDSWLGESCVWRIWVPDAPN